jgi:peroxiredoxin
MGVRPAGLESGKRLAAARLPGVPTEVTVGDPASGSMQLVLFERGHWCPACRRHLRQVGAAIDEFRERQVEVVAVTHESLDELRRATLGNHAPFAIGVDSDLSLGDSLGLAGIDEYGKWTIRPAAIIVRSGGEIAFSYVGDDSIDRLSVPALLLALDRLT